MLATGAYLKWRAILFHVYSRHEKKYTHFKGVIAQLKRFS